MRGEVIHHPACFFGGAAGRVQEPGHKAPLRGSVVVVLGAEFAPAEQRRSGNEQLGRAVPHVFRIVVALPFDGRKLLLFS